MSTAKKEKRRKETKPSNLPYILPVLILSLIAAGAYFWRQQQNQAAAAASAMAVATREARAVEATAEAIAAIPTETAIPTLQPVIASEPTATSTLLPTETAEPTLAPTVAPTETPPPTAAPTETPLPSPTPSPTPSPASVTADVSIRQSQSLVRRGPSSDYSTVLVAAADEPFVATGRTESGNWIEICCVDDEIAWISIQLITTEDDLSALPIAPAPAPLAIVGSGQIPIYNSPSYAEQNGFASAGTVMEVTGRYGSQVWYPVCCGDDGQSGWVYRETVTVDGDTDSLPFVTLE